MDLLVTGAFGFIGANFTHYVTSLGHRVVAYDAMTYAADPNHLTGIPETQLRSVVANICDSKTLAEVLAQGFDGGPFDVVVNFAAESHVDRSIADGLPFVETNVVGAVTLIECASAARVPIFIQISTDEVYGSIDGEHSSTPDAALHPSSAYSASKASADLLLLSYYHTHGYDVRITRCTNNYGRFQHAEKFIPTVILRGLAGEHIPVYGDGLQIRDWIHVEDHCAGILRVIELGQAGKIYHFGGQRADGLNESCAGITNRELCSKILTALSKVTGMDYNKLSALLQTVADRLGHDRRYSLDWSQTRSELGWTPEHPLEEGLNETVNWYTRIAATINKPAAPGVETRVSNL